MADVFNSIEGVNIIVLLVVFLLPICYIFFARDKRRYPPGPMGLPLLGYWPFLAKDSPKALNELAKKYGNVFGLYLGRNYAVVCNDWAAVKDALSKTETLYRPPGIFDLALSGFGSKNGQEWSEQRKFSVKTMKYIGFGRPQWEELVQEEVDEIIQHIQSRIGESLDISDLLESTFTNNVMTMLLGHRLPNSDPTVKQVSQDVDYVLQQFSSLGLGNFLPRLIGFLTTIGVCGSKETVKRLEAFSAVIKSCLQTRLDNLEMDDHESFVKTYFQEVQNNKKNNLNNSFTDSSLLNDTQTLILGGSETTKNSFIWILVAMAQFPEKQDRVHQELDRVLGKNGAIKWSDRASVPYTYAAIMESLRWKSLVPINTLRMTSDDTTILGYDVPKGTIIVSNVWALHNDTRYWSNPDRFEPERFLLDEGRTVNHKQESYIPFSFGRRNCPGEMIALTEILQYFTAIMQKFKVLPQDGDTVKFGTHLGLTYQPQGVKLRFISRE